MLHIYDLIGSSNRACVQIVTLVRKLRLREVKHSPEITQQANGGTGFLIPSSLFSSRSCFPICEMQRPFKIKITLQIVPLLFLVPNSYNLNKLLCSPIPRTQPFTSIKNGSMLSWDKLAGDLAVTFAYSSLSPDRIPQDSMGLISFSSSQSESVGNVAFPESLTPWLQRLKHWDYVTLWPRREKL